MLGRTEQNLLTQIDLRISVLNIDIDCCNLVIMYHSVYVKCDCRIFRNWSL